MTDLNKEREAFLNTFQYYKGRRDIIFSHEHELFMTRSNNPSDIAQKEISNMNSRWDAWLRCAKHRDAELEKAKAQAVPEGFKIVPIELSEEIAERLALERVQKPRPENDPVWVEIAERAYKSNLLAKKWELVREYKI
ncbi:hypothetical protein [Acinetobacter baumannii]|uniref:hypothetical protein n=1 Tax=Acinetobacter baumannii TaxID=470 RepID=UPI000D69864F|nr:hypothetical protein [Acinetobacter baumannii]MBI1413557.1 hypothetical protein [Acinetobacter baumannii]QLI36413.1 hypothetical protein HLG75_10415 [Acinetobacter baumannii]